MNLQDQVNNIVRWHWTRTQRKQTRVLDSVVVEDMLEGRYEEILKKLEMQDTTGCWGQTICCSFSEESELKEIAWEELEESRETVCKRIARLELKQLLYSYCIFQLYDAMKIEGSSEFFHYLYCEEIKRKHALDADLEIRAADLRSGMQCVVNEMCTRKCDVFRSVCVLPYDLTNLVIAWVLHQE